MGYTIYGKTGMTGSASGNCCWRIYTGRGCSGAFYNFVPGETGRMGYGVRTAKVVDC